MTFSEVCGIILRSILDVWLELGHKVYVLLNPTQNTREF